LKLTGANRRRGKVYLSDGSSAPVRVRCSVELARGLRHDETYFPSVTVFEGAGFEEAHYGGTEFLTSRVFQIKEERGTAAISSAVFDEYVVRPQADAFGNPTFRDG
jgi:hypothetical protein